MTTDVPVVPEPLSAVSEPRPSLPYDWQRDPGWPNRGPRIVVRSHVEQAGT